jgi:hypothetical protein
MNNIEMESISNEEIKKDLIDYFDNGKRSVYERVLKYSIFDLKKHGKDISNQNKYRMFLELIESQPKGGWMYRQFYCDMFKHNYVWGLLDIYKTPLLPGAKSERIDMIQLFNEGIYPLHTFNYSPDMMRMAAIEYDKDDYYTLMNKLELLSGIMLPILNEDILSGEFPDFILALYYLNNRLRDHCVWNLNKPYVNRVTVIPEALEKARKYLDMKKMFYSRKGVGKYKLLVTTVRLSTHNPTYRLIRYYPTPCIKRYILKYCNRRTILMLDSNAIACKLETEPFHNLKEAYTEKDYFTILCGLLKNSGSYNGIKRYLFKLVESIKKGYVIRVSNLTCSMMSRIKGSKLYCVEILNLFIDTGLISILLYPPEDGIDNRNSVKKIRQFMVMNDMCVE